MKTFPLPFDPDKLGTPEPGYRYLGADEMPTSNDWFKTSAGWVKSKGPNHSSAGPARPNFTYRRALCVDDNYAPPPSQWSKDGWVVSGPVTSDGKTKAQKDEMYWWPGAVNWSHAVNGLGYWHPVYIRRPISQPVAAPQSAPTQRRSLAIKTNGCPVLNRIIQDLAFEGGWGWPAAFESDRRVRSNLNSHWLIIGPQPNGNLSYGGPAYTPGTQCLPLDARTDLGLIMDRLKDLSAPPPKPVLVAPVVNGYAGEYAKNRECIQFGCAAISVARLRTLLDSMSGHVKWGGNRTVESITLSSGVTLTKANIESILTYVDQVNNQS